MRFRRLSNKSLEELREICQPPSSKGYINMNILRKISIFLSISFLYLGISPTTITYARFFIGLVGIYMIGIGQYYSMLAGLLIFQLAYLLDLNDGEMFRYNTWKTGKKESILIGSFLDKVFDQIYRPLLLIAAGIGSYIYTSNPIYLYLGIASSFLVSTDILIKLRVFDVLIYKQQTKYLKNSKEDLGKGSGKMDAFFELFRINNGLTLYFWFGVFGYLHYFLVIYTPLLLLLNIRTFFREFSYVKSLDTKILGKMYKVK